MFHAVVRSGHDALHFIAEIDGYNIQTLQQYMRGAVRERESPELFVQVDSPEQGRWEKATRRWLSRLSSSGVRVQVETVTAEGIPVSNAAGTFRPGSVQRAA